MTFCLITVYNNLASSVRQKTKRTKAHGIIAQLGEHLPYKQRVIGSSPIGPIDTEYGEIAQLARAHGSYPWCREFESPSRYYIGTLVLLRCFFSTYIGYNIVNKHSCHTICNLTILGKLLTLLNRL